MEPDPIDCPHCARPVRYVWTATVSEWAWVRGNAHEGCRAAVERDERKKRTTRALRVSQVPVRYREWRSDRVIIQDEQPDWQFMGAAHLKPTTMHVLHMNADSTARFLGWKPGNRWMYLEGDVGRGKTMLSSALVRDMVEPAPADFIEPTVEWLAERGLGPTYRPPGSRRRAASPQHQVLFVDWAELMRRVRLAWKGDQAPLKQVGDVSVLVLDDLGSPDKRLRESELSEVEKLLCMRYRDERPTVITSNVPWWEAVDHDNPYFGHRVADRLAEVCDHVTLGGPSWRQPPQRPKPRQEIDRKAAAAGDVGLFGGGCE